MKNHLLRNRWLAAYAAIGFFIIFISASAMPARAALTPSRETQVASIWQALSSLRNLLEEVKAKLLPAQTSGAITSSCPSGYHYMSDTVGYCMSDTSGSTCQPLGGGATYTCPSTTTTGTAGTGGTSSYTSTSCTAALISLLGEGCHQMYYESSNPIFCDGPMTKSAKSGDTTATTGCVGPSGSSSSTATGGTTSNTTTTTSGTTSGTASTTGSTSGTTSGTTSSTGSASGAGLSATVSGTDVTLNWADFHSGEDEYQIERKTGSGAWAKIATVNFLAGGAGTYRDTGVQSGTYDYRVRPCIAGTACLGESNIATATVGGSSTGTTGTTTATPAPVISDSAIGSITSYSANITWSTDIPATSRVEYWVGSSPADSRSDPSFTTNHTVTLSGLQASTTYSYNVISENRDSSRTALPTRTFTTASASSVPYTSTSCTSALISLLGTECHQMYYGFSNDPIFCDGPMTKSAKSGDTTTTAGCVGPSGSSSSTNANQQSHIWRFKDGSTQYSQILARNDSEYTALIAGVDASAAGGYFGGWKPGAGNSANWQEFGIPVVSQTPTSTITGSWQCSDGRDNDNDGFTDYPADSSCYGRDDNDEWYPSSGGTGTTTPSGTPAQPTNANALQSGADVGITWDDNATNEESYRVEWYNGTDWTVMRTVGIVYGGRGSATDYSPSVQKTHQYRVKACNASGCSVPSNAASVYVSGGGVSSNCPAGFHIMSGTGSAGSGAGVGYCMSDADSTVCQPLGGGAYSYACPIGHTATSTSGVVPTLASLLPNAGPIGARVVITGYGFMPTGNRINFDSGVIMDVPSPDGRTLSFTVPEDRVPICAISEPRCLLPAPYAPVKPGTYWVSVVTSAGPSGGIPFSVIEREAGVFSVDANASWPRPGVSADTGTRVRVKFTREIDSVSLAKEFFRITKASAPDTRIPGSFNVFPDGFEFIPSGELEPNTGYTYTVLAGVRDRGGNPLSAPFSASFTTSGSARGSGTIAGNVVDAKGSPLSGVYISVFSPQIPIPYASAASQSEAPSFYDYFSRNTKTDAAGSFQLSVPPGKYMVEAHPPHERTDIFRVAPREVTVTAGETKTVNFTLGGAVKIITGTILFSDGAPVTDAMVGAYASETRHWTSAVAEATGAYTLKVGAGQWLVGIYPKERGANWAWNGKPQGATFARDSREEIITRNFTVTASNAVVVVSATDESGAPVEGAGIIADSHNSGASVSGINASSLPPVPPEFRITGADGKAKFVLAAGTYYLRGYVPQQRGLLNPTQHEVRIAGGGTQEATLVFKKKQTVPALTISGATKIEEGIAVDAFVWAWSEQGGFTSVRAGKDGLFSFGVGAGERWHVGAGKEYKGFPYKSPEIVVDVKTSPVRVELLLTKQTLAPLPPTVSVSEPGSQQVVAQAADGAQITLPPSSATTSGDVKVEIKPTVEAPVQAGTDIVSTVYDVTVWDAAGNSVTSLAKKAEVVIPYSEADLKEQGVSEDAIVPSYFDEKTGTWVKLDGCTIDKERNVAVCRVDHLTRFAITARADSTPPDAPSASAALSSGPGAITITWKNPAKDFDYAKVYRSLKAGELGTVRAATVRGSSFTDNQGFADGATYYYTVRAVDPAGNESVNTAQVSATAKGASSAASTSTKAASAKPVASAPVVGSAVSRTLTLGARGNDVKVLQQILVQEELLSADNATGYFGKLTKAAVIAFQEKYADEILTPAGLAKGSGIVGPGTRKKLNALLK